MLPLPDRLWLRQVSGGAGWTLKGSPLRLAEALQTELRAAAQLRRFAKVRPPRVVSFGAKVDTTAEEGSVQQEPLDGAPRVRPFLLLSRLPRRLDIAR